MRRKLTITLDAAMYDALHTVVGRHEISAFIERALRPRLALALEYQAMAQDEEREVEALEWAEAMIGDVADEIW